MQIKNLEDQYGVKIFERTKKKVYTTEIGAKYT
ncbi:MAG: LysR family transcriptional regulator [Francisella endosymbiont of Hyalomma asiaticum]